MCTQKQTGLAVLEGRLPEAAVGFLREQTDHNLFTLMTQDYLCVWTAWVQDLHCNARQTVGLINAGKRTHTRTRIDVAQKASGYKSAETQQFKTDCQYGSCHRGIWNGSQSWLKISPSITGAVSASLTPRYLIICYLLSHLHGSAWHAVKLLRPFSVHLKMSHHWYLNKV